MRLHCVRVKITCIRPLQCCGEEAEACTHSCSVFTRDNGPCALKRTYEFSAIPKISMLTMATVGSTSVHHTPDYNWVSARYHEEVKIRLNALLRVVKGVVIVFGKRRGHPSLGWCIER